jgi:hypothetical protein
MTDALLLPGSDPLSRSLYEMERIFACSTSLQALLNVATVDAAKEKIHYKEADGTEPRPIICFSLINPIRYQLQAGGDQNYMRPSGEVWVYIAAEPPPEVLAGAAPKKAEEMWAARTFGAILQEVSELSNQDQTFDEDVPDSHPSLVALSILDFSCVPEEHWPSYGRFWWCVYSAQWGDEG